MYIDIKYYCTIFLIGFYSVLSFGQDDYTIDIQYITTENGLSHRNVFRTFRDSEGFIWFGTKYGLNRFDGHDFKVFTKESHGLSFNEVYHIEEDADGWFWLFKSETGITDYNFSDICFFNIHTHKTATLEERFGKKLSFTKSDINTVASAEDGTIYLGTKDARVIIYDGKTFSSIPMPKIESDVWVKIPIEDKFYVSGASENGQFTFLEMDKKGIIHHQNMEPFKKAGFFRTHENQIIAYADEDLKVYGWFKDKWLPIDTLQFPAANYNNRQSTFFHKEGEDLWFETNHELYIYDEANDKYYNLSKINPQLGQQPISNYFIEKNNNNVWISTTNGVYKIKLQRSPFRKLLNIPLNNFNTTFSARAMVRMDNALWVNSNEQKQSHINLETGIATEECLLWRKTNVEYSDIYVPIIPISEDKYLLFSEQGLLYDKKEKTSEIIKWKDEEERLGWSLFEAEDKTIWVGLNEDGLGYKGKLDKFFNYFTKNNDFSGFNKSSVYTFLQLDNENILIGSTTGIYVLNTTKGLTHRFWTGGNDENYIPHDEIYHLHQDEKHPNLIWAATNGGGIFQFELAPNSYEIQNYESFTTANGLSNNIIYAVYEDDYENLWLPSNYGLIQFNKNSHFSTFFLEEDGIAHNEFNRMSHYEDEEGNFYFGGINGVTIFHPSKLLNIKKKITAPLRITDFQQYDGRQNKIVNRTAELLENPIITLNPNDKFFSISVALLEYQGLENVRYLYRLEGEEWLFLDNNTLRISGLPYKNHVLEIRGQSSNGQLSEHILKIPIRVIRPFYLQWYFFMLVFGSIVLSLFYWYWKRSKVMIKRQVELEHIVKKRTETIQQQKEELKELYESKSRFFANISHEFRTPLTVILGITSEIQKEKKVSKNLIASDLKMIERNGKNLLQMVNQILDLTKIEHNAFELQTQKADIVMFLRYVVESLSSYANNENIALVFSSTIETLEADFALNSLQQVMTNFLSNALKFTPSGGEIRVVVSNENDRLKIKIKDTGIGIPEDEISKIFNRFYQVDTPNARVGMGTGIGLAHALELVKLMGGKIDVESTEGKGSTFTVTLPIVLAEAETEILAEMPIELNESNALVKSEKPVRKTNKPSLLIIEDNVDVVFYLKKILSPFYTIMIGYNGRIGIEIALEELPDLIISDVMMPEKDGLEVLDTLKNHELTSHIPIILLTAKVDIDVRVSGLRRGADAYISKPFHREELLETLSMLNENKKRFVAYFSKKYRLQNEKINSKPIEEVQKNTEIEDVFFQKVQKIVAENYQDESFGLPQFCQKIGISRYQLYRKMKAITNESPSFFIKKYRLQKAQEILKSEDFSVKEVAFMVGFKDVSHFSRSYQELFNISPGATIKGLIVN